MERNRLKALRQEKDYTQEYVANKIDIKRSAYAHYENCTREPDSETLSKIADLFDVSIDYILYRTDIRKYNAEILAFNSTENLTESDLEMVRSLIENLKEKNRANK